MYINDLPATCNDVKVQMFADDTVIYTHGRNMADVATKLTSDMERVALWLHDSCLTLNTDKTAVMYFTNKQTKQKPADYPTVTVNGNPIKTVSEYKYKYIWRHKYLGLMLDRFLDFKKHVKKITKTLEFNLATFKSIRNSLSLEAAKSFLNAMILSHLSYCITSWSQANKTNLKSLE